MELTAALILFVLGCQQPAPAPDFAMSIDSVTFRVETTHPTQPVGEPIAVVLTVANQSNRPATLEFTSGQRYDLSVLDAAGGTVWRWSADKAFIQVLGQVRLAPGARLEYRETIAQALAPGDYTVVATLTSSSHPREARAPLTIH